MGPFGNDDKDGSIEKYHDAAMDVLSLFAGRYTPAEKIEAADTYLSTQEIINSIKDLTGTELSKPEVFEMLQNMGYKYDTVNGIEMNWLLIKN